MAKRARVSDTLTGGTKDVNPQYLRGSITLSAANTVTQAIVGTPIVRVGPATGNSAIIMELISLWVNFPALDLDAAAATNRGAQFSMSTSTSPTAITLLSDASNLAFMQHTVRNAFTAAGTGTLDSNDDPHYWSFTDGAGHGILVATDNIFFQASTTGYNAAVAFEFKLSYRFKKVSLVEYIGIVQSQE